MLLAVVLCYYNASAGVGILMRNRPCNKPAQQQQRHKKLRYIYTKPIVP